MNLIVCFAYFGNIGTNIEQLGGWATDRYRRVALHAIGPAVGAVGEILMVFAPRWGWLVPGYLLAVFSGLFVGPALFGLVSDVGPEETRASRYAYQAAAFGVCATVGPALGGYIYEYLGYRAFMVMRGRVSPLACARSAGGRQAGVGIQGPGFLDRIQTGRPGHSLLPAVPAVLPGGVLGGLRRSGHRQPFLRFHESGRSRRPGEHGCPLLHCRRGHDHRQLRQRHGFGPLRARSRSSGWPSSAWSWATSGSSGPGRWRSWARSGFTRGLVGNFPGPALDALLADITDQESRGTVRSVFSGLQNLAMLPAPLVGGLLWDTVSPAAPFWFAAAVTLVGALILIFWMREPKRKNQAGQVAEAGW